MPSTLGIGRRNLRHLNFCFSNFTHPFPPESPSTKNPTATATSSSTQHDIDHNHPSSTTSSIMIKNFNSLYDHTLTLEQYCYSHCSSSLSTTTSFEPEPEPEPADFATVFASQRFFFSSPGRSNSIIESTNTESTDCTPPSSSSSSSSSSLMATAQPPEDDDNKKKLFFNGSVAVPTYSPDPYLDFRRSMEEMVEARPELMDVKSNWDVLHELLLCYLALNPKSTHKFILSAFADLLVSLMSFSSSPPTSPLPVAVDVKCVRNLDS